MQLSHGSSLNRPRALSTNTRYSLQIVRYLHYFVLYFIHLTFTATAYLKICHIDTHLSLQIKEAVVRVWECLLQDVKY